MKVKKQIFFLRLLRCRHHVHNFLLPLILKELSFALLPQHPLGGKLIFISSLICVLFSYFSIFFSFPSKLLHSIQQAKTCVPCVDLVEASTSEDRRFQKITFRRESFIKKILKKLWKGKTLIKLFLRKAFSRNFQEMHFA